MTGLDALPTPGPIEPTMADTARGVLVHVDIAPLACPGSCDPGILAATGGAADLLIFTAAGLLAAGVALLVLRAVRQRRVAADASAHAEVR